ncbi:hypothetical protein ACIPUC_36690 [Streptomyces sp. LARHCF249]
MAALEERIDAQRAFRELAERHAALSEPLRAALDLVVLDQLTPAEAAQALDDGRTLKVNPKAVPPGHTLVCAWAYFQPWWEGKQGLAFGVLRNEDVPYCSVDYRETFLEEQRSGRPTPPPGVPATISP